jgi:hypothetical protein
MTRLALLPILLLAVPSAAAAQALIVNACNSLPTPYVVGSVARPTIDVNGQLCVVGPGGLFSVPPPPEAPRKRIRRFWEEEE